MKFTDEIRVNAPDGTAEATLFVDADADYLRDHFPGAPMLPGLVMLEAAVRTAAALWVGRHTSAPFAAALDRVERLHVVRRVVPGETFVVRAEILPLAEEGGSASFNARGFVGGAVAMRARFRLRALEASY